MGSGKSTVGKYLAKQLHKEFVDTDTLIEAQESKSINQIFAEHGENYFRELEQKIISKILQKEDQVISLGGGAIVNDATRKLVRDNSVLISLIADPRDLYSRIKRRKNRPLLNKVDDQLEALEKLWEVRKFAYYDSDFQIDTSDKSINKIGLEIMQALGLKKPKFQEQEVVIHRGNFTYHIYFKDLDRLNIDSIHPGKQVLIVSQKPIAKHYLAIIEEKLSTAYSVHVMYIDDGEEAKNFLNYQLILQRLLTLNFERKDTLIALGGGVIGDLAGFAASTYYRGINYIQIPTSLLSMIDSSVGGKTGINVPEGKNLIGSFYQPHMVHIDVNNLKTLSEKEYKSGLGELVKYTLLGEKWDQELGDNFFEFIFNQADAIVERDPDLLNQVIYHCLRIKAGIVAKDETEHGQRAHLNLGHTFGHAIEELTLYKKYSHGQAVAIGIICACYLAEDLSLFKPDYTKQIIKLMKIFGLEYAIPKDLKTADIIQAFKYDKKNQAGIVNFVLPKANIGKVELVSNIDCDQVARAIDRNRI